MQKLTETPKVTRFLPNSHFAWQIDLVVFHFSRVKGCWHSSFHLYCFTSLFLFFLEDKQITRHWYRKKIKRALQFAAMCLASHFLTIQWVDLFSRFLEYTLWPKSDTLSYIKEFSFTCIKGKSLPANWDMHVHACVYMYMCAVKSFPNCLEVDSYYCILTYTYPLILTFTQMTVWVIGNASA